MYAAMASSLHSHAPSSLSYPRTQSSTCSHPSFFRPHIRLGQSGDRTPLVSRTRVPFLVTSASSERHISASAAAATAAESATVLSPEEVSSLCAQWENASPLEIMDKALALFGEDAAIAFSGAEDVALIELASLTGRPFRVFCLDTGRLNPETYRFLDKVRSHYNIAIEVMFPDASAVQHLVQTKGLFSFFEDGHQECCSIRKVEPLKRALKGLSAWITGQRRDQSVDTRGSLQVVEVDKAFPGKNGAGTLVKFNPLARASGATVWSFLDAQKSPLNELHEKGYVSIGCEPCTRPVLPHQHEREGRWWWESSAAKECGLHKAAPSPGTATASAPTTSVVPSIKSEEAEEIATDGASSPVAAVSSVTLSREEQDWPDLYVSPHVTELTREMLQSLLSGDGNGSSIGSGSSILLVVYAPWCPFCQALEPALCATAEALAGSATASTVVAKFRGDRQEREFVSKVLGVKSFPSIFMLRPQQQQPGNEDGILLGSAKLVKRLSERRDVASLLRWVEALQ